MNDEKDVINKNTPLYSISTAAKLLGISVPTIRMYEKEGLVVPPKEEGHNRLFSEADIERIKCIRNAIKERKYTIPAIKMMYSFIPCWKIIKCSDEERNNCPSFLNSGKPCWAHKKVHGDACNEINCRNCEVYTSFVDCEDIRKSINNYLGK